MVRLMEGEHLDTQHRAQQVNFDRSKYGAFAEIGAGQEVARWFFRAGGAAGTISKSMSAYDMTVSDAIYGPAERYVSQQRLNKMLEHEYELMYERLAKQRGATTKFFVFADTVAARSYTRKEDGNGWMGIRFQTEPLAPPSDIIIHVRLLDQDNLLQQEALGVVGVNLIYGAMYLHEDPEKLIGTLLDNLSPNRVEVDMIKFSGPAFAMVDNRVMSLQLVQQGLTNAAMFNADGEVVNAADVLYKKSILIERGSFRPVTKTTLHMLQSAMAQFVQEPEVHGEEVIVLFEMTLKNLTASGVIDHKDFLERVDMLGAVGKTVIVSNYGEYHRLASYLFRYTKKLVGLVMGVPTLKELFEEKYYADLEGGILESFGRLFKNDLKLYAYPFRDPTNNCILTADNLRVVPHLAHLYAYLIENRSIVGLRDYNEDYLSIFSRDALAKIRAGDPEWESMVPPQVSKMIKERKLLGCAG